MAEVMPGTTSKGTPAASERGGLLAAPGEHERIAALEPHHRLAGPAPLDQQRVDVVLGHRGAAGRLADVDALGRRPAPGRAGWPPTAGRRRRRRPGASTSAPRTVSSPGSPGPAPTR